MGRIAGFKGWIARSMGCSDEEKGSDLCHIASKKAPATGFAGELFSFVSHCQYFLIFVPLRAVERAAKNIVFSVLKRCLSILSYAAPQPLCGSSCLLFRSLCLRVFSTNEPGCTVVRAGPGRDCLCLPGFRLSPLSGPVGRPVRRAGAARAWHTSGGSIANSCRCFCCVWRPTV